MLEIPGEEAPTDPGLEMRKKQEGIARAQARTRKTIHRIAAVFLTGIIFVAGGISYWYVQRQLEAMVYDLDDIYIAPRDRLLAARPVPPPALVAVRTGSGSPRSARSAPDPEESNLPDAAAVASGSGATTTVKYVPPTRQGDASVGLAAEGSASVGLGGADIAVFRVGDDVLTDDEAIFRMAKEAITAYGPQMETCAAQRMKQDENFGGAWKLNFTIEKDGTVSKAKVTGRDHADAELEACMTRAASSWRFAKIARPFPVSKTYPFVAAAY